MVLLDAPSAVPEIIKSSVEKCLKFCTKSYLSTLTVDPRSKALRSLRE